MQPLRDLITPEPTYQAPEAPAPPADGHRGRPRVTLRLSSSVSTFGEGVVLIAEVAGDGRPVHGQMAFVADGTIVDQRTLRVQGVSSQIEFRLVGLAAGTHSLQARYLGSRTFAAVDSAPVEHRVIGRCRPSRATSALRREVAAAAGDADAGLPAGHRHRPPRTVAAAVRRRVADDVPPAQVLDDARGIRPAAPRRSSGKYASPPVPAASACSSSRSMLVPRPIVKTRRRVARSSSSTSSYSVDAARAVARVVLVAAVGHHHDDAPPFDGPQPRSGIVARASYNAVPPMRLYLSIAFAPLAPVLRQVVRERRALSENADDGQRILRPQRLDEAARRRLHAVGGPAHAAALSSARTIDTGCHRLLEGLDRLLDAVLDDEQVVARTRSSSCAGSRRPS